MSAFNSTSITSTPTRTLKTSASSEELHGTPALDYTRVTSILNPVDPPVGTRASEFFTQPITIASPAAMTDSRVPAMTDSPASIKTDPAAPAMTDSSGPVGVAVPAAIPAAVPAAVHAVEENTPPAHGMAVDTLIPPVPLLNHSIVNHHAIATVNHPTPVQATTAAPGPILAGSQAEDEDSDDDDDDDDADIGNNNPSSGSNRATLANGTFRCINDEHEECRTGQVTLDLSRKVISDHFGRNKACTRLIKDWPLFCRKHYQRATYNQKLWQARKITLILRQFNIIDQQFPGTKYTVALKKSEENRLNTFSRKIASGLDPEEATAFVAPEKGKHFEAPVEVLREIEQLNYLGQNKTKAEVEECINSIYDMLHGEETDQVPSIEFLPQLDQNGKPFDANDRGKKAKKATPRVSAKGAIQKTSGKTGRGSKKAVGAGIV